MCVLTIFKRGFIQILLLCNRGYLLRQSELIVNSIVKQTVLRRVKTKETDTEHTNVREDLGKPKIKDEQKAKRMEISGDLISMCDQDPLHLENIVTVDETWSYQFDPE